MGFLGEKYYLQIQLLIVLSVVGYTLQATQSFQQDVMKEFSFGFGRHMFECQRNMNFSETVFDDFLAYWNGAELNNKDMGCAIICILLKLELLDNDGKLLDDNCAAFISASGGDAEMVNVLMESYHHCVESLSHVKDPCLMALELAKCFRSKIKVLNWTPNTHVSDNDTEFVL